MAVGYEGYAVVNGVRLLATGASVPQSRQRLESAGAFGGVMDYVAPPTSNPMGVAAPRTYDVDLTDGSVDFEVTAGTLTLLDGFLRDRDAAFAVEVHTRRFGSQVYYECYWNNWSFSVGENSAVAGSLSWVAIRRDEHEIEDAGGLGYIDNAAGWPNTTDMCPEEFDELEPWWKFTTEVGGNAMPFQSWSLTFAQPVERLFACEGPDAGVQAPSSGAQVAKRIVIGPLTGQFQGDMFVDPGIIDISPVVSGGDWADTLASLKVIHDGADFVDLSCDLSEDADNIPGQDSIVPVSLTYDIYGVTLP